MEYLQNIFPTLFDSAIQSLFYNGLKLIIMIFLLFVGSIFATLVKKSSLKSMKNIQIDRVSHKFGIADFLEKVGIEQNLSQIFSNIFYWAVFILIGIISLDILGFSQINQLFINLVYSSVDIFKAIMVILMGAVLAKYFPTIIKKNRIMTNIPDRFEGLLVLIFQWGIMFVSISFALYHINIGRGLLVAVYVAVIGTIGLVFTFSFGLAGVDLARGALMGKIIMPMRKEDKPDDLTDKQYKLYVYVKNFIKIHNRSPVIREIQESLGDKSTKSVAFKLQRLQEKGYLYKEKGKHRSLKIVKQ